MKMNKKKIEQLWREILIEIGEDINRRGLEDTPSRIAKMYKELFKGYIDEPPKITIFQNGQDNIIYNQMIIDEGDFYSHCEHHCVPFFGKYYFAYIPSENGNILGLSKVARVIDYFSARLQIQERLVKNIIDYLWQELSKDNEPPLGMALIMKGEHLCKTMRGVKKRGQMTCSYMKGVFLKPEPGKNPKEEFLRLINLNGNI